MTKTRPTKTCQKPSANTLGALALALAFLGGISSAAVTPAAAQTAAKVPAMRTRLLTSLTGYEVDEYIKRNDVIYVPVGPTEVHGEFPTDIEYAVPLAYAIKLAEKTDGLVFPYLAYFYPGGTTTSHGTVYTSTSESLPYLKSLTRSLLRQGFRRIVFITAHGPSGNTMTPLVREIYDELHAPVVWMSASAIHGAVARGAVGPAQAGLPQGAAAEADALSENKKKYYGALLALGRLDDVPLGMTEPKRDVIPMSNTVSRLAGGGNSLVGQFYGDPSEHAGYVVPVTAEQRAAWAKEGLATIDANVAAYDADGLLAAIRAQYEFTRKVERKYGDLLPPGPSKY